MNQDDRAANMPPFPADYRASGVLLHVTSLPSRYGIGDVGPGAIAWIDRLHAAHQRWWQALPLGPTGYGDSPYQSLSSFAGNGLLISPDWLIEDGLLEPDDCPGSTTSTDAIDYNAVIAFKHGLLPVLHDRFISRARADLKIAFEDFCQDQAHWLDDYAHFRALKRRHGGAHYLNWPRELIEREPEAMKKSRQDLARQIEAIRLAQFVLFRQARRMIEYAHAKEVRLIGDMPFFVAPDSSDVWANPHLFLLDAEHHPIAVAGVPPDYFSRTGQRWGNPVYNWEAHRKSGYKWWISRLRSLLGYVDVIRLDHFRGFAAAWHVPASARTAESGQWVTGPGPAIFTAFMQEVGSLPFIAEDLGHITPDVTALLQRFRLPGTKVLQFAFDGNPDNPFLPHNYDHNTVAYTATHDNNTTRGWYDDLPADERKHLWRHLNRPAGSGTDAAWELIRMALFSEAALSIIPLQDLLNLGEPSRMNVPGRADGNWRWRHVESESDQLAFARLGELTHISNRTA